uniref:Uncharacterized protein n=1 Tax=Megaviridae environmental sample TaxID=1737588 RepID=A0A5J6VKP9_9VIRU|nr:MAG: hypothetical protein [Megaviridae environmental sample]
MTNTYRLVNPYIKGEFNSKVKANNSIEAAREIYKNISEHFNNNLPKFYFTILKGHTGASNKFYHFEVKETKVNDEVNFSLESYQVKDESEQLKKFKANLKKFKGRFNKEGGGKKRSSRKRSSKKRSGKKRSSKKRSGKKRSSKKRSGKKSRSKGKKRSSKKRSRKKSRSKGSSKRRRSKRNSSSSDSDDFYRYAQSYVPVVNQPISYMYYDPLVYRLDTVHIPTFYAYVTPYIEINLLP